MTFQKAFENSILAEGGSNYQLAHSGKETLRRKNQLPEILTRHLEIVETTSNVLQDI